MQFKAGDKKVICPCCQHDNFEKDYRQLNTQGATLFNLDWMNRDALILVCDNCSHIAWFMNDLEEIE